MPALLLFGWEVVTLPVSKGKAFAPSLRALVPMLRAAREMNFPVNCCRVLSQSVSYFTVPPRAHPSTGSQSGSATNE